jgi:uncharacterized iron-regulated membrane protein
MVTGSSKSSQLVNRSAGHGVYLWWPRGQRRGLRGVLLPRFDLRGKRLLWRDIHAVTGILSPS